MKIYLSLIYILKFFYRIIRIKEIKNTNRIVYIFNKLFFEIINYHYNNKIDYYIKIFIVSTTI